MGYIVSNSSYHSHGVGRGPHIKAEMHKAFTKLKLLLDLILPLLEIFHYPTLNSVSTSGKMRCQLTIKT